MKRLVSLYRADIVKRSVLLLAGTLVVQQGYADTAIEEGRALAFERSKG